MTSAGPGPGEDEVRELLAQLGGSLADPSPLSPDEQAIPPEVAARVEAALAELPATGEPEVVVALRPRRRVGPWLVAAAVVLVVGGGGWALTHRPAAHDGAASATADSAADSAAGAAGGQASASSSVGGRRLALPSVSSTHFARDVRLIVAPEPTTSTYSSDLSAAAQAPDAAASKAAKEQRKELSRLEDNATIGRTPQGLDTGRSDCTRPSGAKGRQIVVSFDGALAQLIVADRGGAQVVTAYDCGGDRTLATTTIR